MPKAIDDAFSSIPGRQRRYQLRNRAEGTCVGCRNPTEHGKRYCPACIKRTADKRARTKHLNGAAVEMLEVLREMFAAVELEGADSDRFQEARIRCQDVIAQAEGRL